MPKAVTPNLAKLVEYLNDGQWHDGQRLGERLGISRSAIWKLIKKLENHDIQIESQKGKGYRLQQPLCLLKQAQLQQSVADLAEVLVFESIESTNDYCRNLEINQQITFCIAEQQTKGRGRFSRPWLSPFAKNISMSCAYPFENDISKLAGLSLVVALAIARSIESFLPGNHLKIKWPNDLLVSGAKLAGILVEIKAETHGYCQAIIGVGINVNSEADSLRLDKPWTALQRVVGRVVDRNQLLAVMMPTLLQYLERFKEQGLDGFLKEWETFDALQGQAIVLQIGDREVSGIAQGVSEQGCLLLKNQQGDIEQYSAGEVSLKDYNTKL